VSYYTRRSSRHAGTIHITRKILLTTLLANAVIITAATALPTPAALADPQSVTGSIDDWEGAVCATGSVISGKQYFRNAVASDWCLDKNHSEAIYIAQWNDNYMMVNDITMFQRGFYASAKSGQNIVDLVTLTPSGAAALQPLTRFGFVVNPTPVRGQ
jgi:hypothetical protein